MNEPPGLHRTISEPYNFDDDDERSLHNASPPHRIYQAPPAPRPVTNTRRLPPEWQDGGCASPTRRQRAWEELRCQFVYLYLIKYISEI
ncbi:hypothetical protein O3P69_019355 [Scylla paramamosain]|uniref:Uncharacterized protein n=1 Tax=Scylla paramamosain TaxID=85552 RepID=A0AAW0SWR4_SCYPA